MQTNTVGKFESMQKIEILQGLKKVLHYYKQVNVINEAVRIILLYNKSVATVLI